MARPIHRLNQGQSLNIILMATYNILPTKWAKENCFYKMESIKVSPIVILKVNKGFLKVEKLR